MLLDNEYVMPDYKYGGPSAIHFIDDDEDLPATLLAIHETVNKRLKFFNVFGCVFQHDLSLTSVCFHTVANLIAITL